MKIDTAFKITRPALSVTGLFAQVDPNVKHEIALLNTYLSKKVLVRCGDEFYLNTCPPQGWTAATAKTSATAKKFKTIEELLGEDIRELIHELGAAIDDDQKFNFSDVIDQKGDTSLLYEVEQKFGANKNNYNANILLSEAPILAYLFCRAAYHVNLRSFKRILAPINFIN
jgi:hypothetical protein